MSLDRVIRSLEDHFVALTDGHSGASELAISGQAVTAGHVAFLARTGGIIGIVTTPERRDELGLPPMPQRGRGSDRLGYHVTFESRSGIPTPASARPDTHRKPFGLAEAAVHLASLAGIFPVVAHCALLDERGRLLVGAKLEDLCERGGFERVWIEEFWDRSDSDIVDLVAAGVPCAI